MISDGSCDVWQFSMPIDSQWISNMKQWQENGIAKIVKLLQLIYFITKALFCYSGLEFIIRKFIPLQNPQPLPTGFIWLVGIYIALFGVASQRYENRVDIIETRTNSIFSQLSTNAYKKALGRIATVQNMWCPEKPEVLKPLSVLRSLLYQTRNDETVQLLKETLEDWKNSLNNISLIEANLENAKLSEAYLKNADLEHAYLQGADLRGADLENSNLKNAILIQANFHKTKLLGANLENAELSGAFLEQANLQGSNLHEADLQGANLKNADLRGANIEGADLRNANLVFAKFERTDFQDADVRNACFLGADFRGVENLSVDSICGAKYLYDAKFDPKLEKLIFFTCPNIIKKIPEYEDILNIDSCL